MCAQCDFERCYLSDFSDEKLMKAIKHIEENPSILFSDRNTIKDWFKTILSLGRGLQAFNTLIQNEAFISKVKREYVFKHEGGLKSCVWATEESLYPPMLPLLNSLRQIMVYNSFNSHTTSLQKNFGVWISRTNKRGDYREVYSLRQVGSYDMVMSIK